MWCSGQDGNSLRITLEHLNCLSKIENSSHSKPPRNNLDNHKQFCRSH